MSEQDPSQYENQHENPQENSNRSGARGILGGVMASLYCIVAGGLGVSGAAYNFFINQTASIVAAVYGLVSLVLLILVARRYSGPLNLLGLNLSIVFALVLVVLFFTNGGQPELQQIFRLVLQLAVVWIIFSTFSHLRKINQTGHVG